MELIFVWPARASSADQTVNSCHVKICNMRSCGEVQRVTAQIPVAVPFPDHPNSSNKRFIQQVMAVRVSNRATAFPPLHQSLFSLAKSSSCLERKGKMTTKKIRRKERAARDLLSQWKRTTLQQTSQHQSEEKLQLPLQLTIRRQVSNCVLRRGSPPPSAFFSLFEDGVCLILRPPLDPCILLSAGRLRVLCTNVCGFLRSPVTLIHVVFISNCVHGWVLPWEQQEAAQSWNRCLLGPRPCLVSSFVRQQLHIF